MKRTILICVVLGLVVTMAAISQTPSLPKHHVVFQLSEAESDEWGLVSAHVNNLKAAFANDGGAEVEVVFFGDGINMLRKSKSGYAGLLKQLADNGVIIAACRNAMNSRGLKTEDLVPFATQVDAGVAELARKQEAGWAYIH
jgi:intracellular sulfur oxidation DsrE/DsrF family protein